jgi:hypothetical protein
MVRKLIRDKRKLKKMKCRYYFCSIYRPFSLQFAIWLSGLSREPTQAELVRLDSLQ